MQNNKQSIALFGNVKILVFAAFLCAISGIMKLLAPSGDTWRVSLENFPIIFVQIAQKKPKSAQRRIHAPFNELLKCQVEIRS